MPLFEEEPAPGNPPPTCESDPFFIDETPPRRPGYPWIAWGVILLMIGVLFNVYRWQPPEHEQQQDRQMSLIIFELQAKMLVGGASILPDANTRKQFAGSVESLNTGSLDQRLRCITVIGEVSGPKEALGELDSLHKAARTHQIEFSRGQQEAFDLLKLVYQDEEQKHRDIPSLNESQRLGLQKNLGWFGTLALNPEKTSDEGSRDTMLEPARRAFLVYMLAVFGAVVLGFLGLVGLLLLVALVVQRQIRFGLRAPPRWGGVYAETFALWMVLFLVFSLIANAALKNAPSNQLVGTLVTQILSLTALFWPLWRGVPQHELCRDIGLVGGPHPEREFFLGIANYVMTLPVLALGLIATFVVMIVVQALSPKGDPFSSPSVPAHPILQFLLEGSTGHRLQIFIVASIAAPIIEETMFRGVLYRHLREATHRFAYPLSVVASMLFTSFVFAVIHPQGIVAVPALMCIALGLNWAREWRGSLIASMVAHGINNGIVLLLVVMAFG